MTDWTPEHQTVLDALLENSEANDHEAVQPVQLSGSKRRAVCDGRLVPPDEADTGAAQWQQVAYSGRFDGYKGGSFEFTGETFAQIVANFRASPNYRPDGSGMVVPWDVAHLSEQAGGLPAHHEAVGWISELALRPGAGRLELWARTCWTPAMAQLVKSGAFAYASVVVDFATIDPQSGRNIGASLSSVAATNQPFLQGLQRLAASHTAPGNTMPLRLALTPARGGKPGTLRLAASASTSPEQASAQLDARNQLGGRNAVERAVLAMRTHSPRFSALPLGEQIHEAGAALRSGAVIA